MLLTPAGADPVWRCGCLASKPVGRIGIENRCEKLATLVANVATLEAVDVDERTESSS